MISLIRRGRRTAVILGCVLALGLRPAAAQDNAVLNLVVDLNKKALASYENLDMEVAARQLKQAIELCLAEGLDRHPTLARTHIHLGVIYVSGLKDKTKGISEFRRALGIDPNIKVTKSLLNPEVQAAFDEAYAMGAQAPSPSEVPFPTGQAPAETKRTAPVTINPTAINHPPVTEAIGGKPIEIKAQIPAGLHAERIILAYRADDQEEFLAREMHPVENATGWYHKDIPIEATEGDYVAYYIEAQNSDGQAFASSGDATHPHIIRLSTQAAAVAVKDEPREATGGANESPLWVVFALGTGGGYISGSPEMNPRNGENELKASGARMAKLAHLAPEIGYYHSERIRLSVQGRIQYVTGGQDVVKDGKTYRTARFALAVLAKASYLLAQPAMAFQPFVSAQLGWGEIRYPTTTIALPGCGPDNTTAPCKDTVRGGPGLAGVAMGFVYRVSESVGLYAALSGLAGVPNIALDADLNVGLALIR